MSKERLIDRMAVDHGMTKRDAELAIARVCASIKAATDAGEKITLRGFGVFERKHVPDRVARNPRTMEPITIAAHEKLKFKPL